MLCIIMIDELIKRHTNTEVFIMYDVACMLHKYLKV